MKKIFLILTISLFLLTSCSNSKDSNNDNKKVVKADLDNLGNIVIKEKDITDEATYISYKYDGVVIGLIAVKNSSGDDIVLVNTCASCGGSPNAYFIMKDGKLECQNCHTLFDIDDLDNIESDGCNPIKVNNIKKVGSNIIVNPKELQELKDKFKNWNGPK